MHEDNHFEIPVGDGPSHEASASRRRSAIIGVLVGVTAVSASLVGVGALAGAQSEPSEPEFDEMDDGESDAEDLELGEPDDEGSDADDSEFDGADGGEPDAEDLEFDETDGEGSDAEDAAWAPFDECFDGQLAGLDQASLPDEDADLTSDEWDALDATFEAAEQACFDLLPEDAKAEATAFQAYDQCLTDAGFGDEFWDSAAVYVEDANGGQSILFGDGTGTVTVSGDATGLTVSSEGDVTVIDDDTADAAFETCEALLPADLLDGWEDDGYED